MVKKGALTIAGADIAGTNPGAPQGGATGRTEATFTFFALDDGTEDENGIITLTITGVEFGGVVPASNITMDDIEGNEQAILIVARPPHPFAVFEVEDSEVKEGEGLNPADMPNAEIILGNIDVATLDNAGTVVVSYTFDGQFSNAAAGEPPHCTGSSGAYCAFGSISATPNRAAARTGLSTPSFSFDASLISEGTSEAAQFRIFILPRDDNDGLDETVELRIVSIVVPQSDGEPLILNAASGNLVGNDNKASTDAVQITIKDDDAIRLFLKSLFESSLQPRP